MSASRSYGKAPKSKARKAKNHWIRFEEIANEYMDTLPGSVWATYTALFTFRNRNTNQCFPRYQKIADKRGVHRRTIIRHVAVLVKVGLIEKEHRFYDDYEKHEYGGQRSNKYWFVSFSPQDVTPRMTAAPPLTRSSSKQRYTKPIQESTEVSGEPCDHPWGNPMDYPHEGFWRCSLCGDPYKRN
jgi:Helix-turn-helix domain